MLSRLICCYLIKTPIYWQQIATNFYKRNAAVVKRNVGKGSATYIVLVTDDSKLKKDVLRTIYKNAGVTTKNYL